MNSLGLRELPLIAGHLTQVDRADYSAMDGGRHSPTAHQEAIFRQGVQVNTEAKGEAAARPQVDQSGNTEVLQGFREFRQEFEKLRGDVASLKTLPDDVGSLKTDVGSLKTDVGSLKTDVGSLTARVNTLATSDALGNLNATVRNIETDVSQVKEDLSRLERRLEFVEADAAIARNTSLNLAGAGRYRQISGAGAGPVRGDTESRFHGDTQPRVNGHSADPSKRKRAGPSLY